MKVEKISDNRLKVVLTSQDLADRQVTLPELFYGSEKSQELCAEIMAQVKEQCDFTFDDDCPLIIEMIPMSKDDLTIIVSRVNMLSELEKKLEGIGFNFMPNAKTERKFIKKTAGEVLSAPALGENRVVVFMFASLDDVAAAAKRIIGGGACGPNTLYKLDKKYYLFISPERGCSDGEWAAAERVLSDYGQRHTGASALTRSYMAERGELVAEHAVFNIAKFL